MQANKQSEKLSRFGDRENNISLKGNYGYVKLRRWTFEGNLKIMHGGVLLFDIP
jgi:hypothetical protein